MSKPFFITTPIYYPNGNLHMGNAYTTILADAIARFKKAHGYDVFFLTGTDEHGLKLQRAAENAGKTPKEYIDEIVISIKNLWQALNIDYTKFIRTTDEDHVKKVQDIFQKLYNQGDIYKSTYDGWYCVQCETFWTNTQLGDDHICPDCHRPVEQASEESYFFKMSKYTARLKDYINSHPDFIKPITRRNEVLAFLDSGVEDLCVSRTTFDWGIKVPFDEKHVIYVWLDALTNYPNALNPEQYAKFWGEATHHLVGKDILRFHAVIWPCILFALNMPLPHQVYAHGWLLLGDGKMSKSKSGAIDPAILAARYGADAVRYFELREMSYGEDGHFSIEQFLERFNQDLVNDLGNLVSRTTAMAEKYFAGKVKDTATRNSAQDVEFDEIKITVKEKVVDLFNEFKLSDAMREAFELVRACNKYIETTEPWNLAKDDSNKQRLEQVIFNLLDGIKLAADLLAPAMPETAEKIYAQIGFNTDKFTAKKGPALFPRVDIKEELEALNAI